MAEGTQCAQALKCEQSLSAAANLGNYVGGAGGGFARGVLCSGRNSFSGDSLDGCTIAQRPHLAFISFQFEPAIHQQTALVLRTFHFLKNRLSDGWNSRDDGLTRD